MQVKERVKDSMYALGMPITQGAITTILGVIGLGLAPSYIFVTFFKMVLLVIVLGKCLSHLASKPSVRFNSMNQHFCAQNI